MWDSNVEMIGLAMKADDLSGIPEYKLPPNYGWRYFQPGDERIWAEIEMSAGEFTCVENGIEKFHFYYPDETLLTNRMIFLTDGGKPFATATAWFSDDDPSEGRLHWVSVDQEHQGKGLSKPLVSIAMHRMRELGFSSAYLTTQTASWVAIKVYRKFGFHALVRSEKEAEGWKIVEEKTKLKFL